MKGRNNNNAPTPLWSTRLVSLFFSFAFAVIGGSVGLNALIKSNQQKTFVRKHALDGATIEIDTNDIFRSGIVLTTVCALLAVISLVSLLLHISTLSLSSSPPALRIQSLSLLFTTTWLFASLVPFDKFARQGTAHVVARLGNLVLPATFVQAEEAQIGVSPEYWSLKFIRYVAIIPWFTFLFGVIAGVVLWVAARRILFARRVVAPGAGTIDSVVVPQEKQVV